jgi:molecular chaperone DnaK
MQDAEKFAEEDRSRREAAEARNTADNLAYQAEKTLNELGDKVEQSDREAVEKAVADVKEALKGEDIDRIKSTTETLMQAFQKVGQSVYAQQQAASGGGGEEEGPSGGEDVVEGEVVDEGGA